MKSPLFFYFRFKFYFFFHNIILYLYIPVLCHLVFSYSIFTLIFSPFFYILFHFPSLTFFKIIYFSRFNLISFYFLYIPLYSYNPILCFFLYIFLFPNISRDFTFLFTKKCFRKTLITFANAKVQTYTKQTLNYFKLCFKIKIYESIPRQ